MELQPITRVMLLSTLTLLPLRATAQTVTYLAFGDSITVGVGDAPEEDEFEGYPPKLEALLMASGIDAEVLNYGYGGEKTTEGVTRIDEVLAEVEADYLLLMEGTNDISHDISRETTLFNLDQMALKAELKGMETLHTTVVPRFPLAKVDRSNITNKRLNEGIRNLAGVQLRQLTDAFEIFGQEPDLFRRLYADIQGDPVGHPNAAGYEVIAEAFSNVLLNIDRLPPVAGELEPTHLAEDVDPMASITVEMWDFGAGIDETSLILRVDNELVGFSTDLSGRSVALTYTPDQPLEGVVRVEVSVSDLDDPVNSMDREVLRFAILGTTFLDGDIDRSGRVDGRDLAILAVAFGARRGQARYVRAADINNDRIIDGTDLAVIASEFGLSSV